MNSVQFLFCTTIFGCGTFLGQTIAGNELTNDLRAKGLDIGEWGTMEKCPDGEFATSMQVMTQPFQGPGDDTGVNAIKFRCSKPKSKEYSGVITSTNGTHGEWGKEIPCESGSFKGYQLLVDPYVPSFDDCWGVVNVRVFCEGQENVTAEGATTKEGPGSGITAIWTPELRCPSSQGICGIQTRVLDNGADKCGITNVKMECCDCTAGAVGDAPKAAAEGPEGGVKAAEGESYSTNCTTPDDHWFLLAKCDNTAGTSPISCAFTKKRGLEAVGSKNDVDLGAVATTFKTKLPTSTKTKHVWSHEPESTFKGQSDSTLEFSVPVGVKVQVSQAVGTCAHLTVFSGGFKRVDTKPGKADTEIQIQQSEDMAKFIQDIATFLVTHGDPPPGHEPPKTTADGAGAAKPTDGKGVGAKDNDGDLKSKVTNVAAVPDLPAL